MDPSKSDELSKVQAMLAYLASQGISRDQFQDTVPEDLEEETQDYQSQMSITSSKDVVEELINFPSLLKDLDTRFPGTLAPGAASIKPVWSLWD